MSKGVVDLLEPVEVDEQQGNRCVIRNGQYAVEVLQQSAPIAQPCEIVGAGLGEAHGDTVAGTQLDAEDGTGHHQREASHHGEGPWTVLASEILHHGQ